MTPGTGSTLNYAFDASANLTTMPTGATGTYDKSDEVTSSTLTGTTTSYTYSADGERLTAKQGSATIASGSWNGARQLTAYSDNAANMTTASYDGNGLRASDTTTPSGGSASTQDFLWNTTTQVPSLLMDSAYAYLYTGSGAPAEQVNLSSGSITYLVSDLLGSVRGIVSTSGALVASTAYDAWGNPESSGGLTSYSAFGYGGAYTDPTGMLYLINRYYDPQAGQFVSVDPAVAQTLQPYEYADGNPVSNTDPTGEEVATQCIRTSSFTEKCGTAFDHKASEEVIHTFEAINDVGEGCEAISDYIPTVGDILAVICTVLGNGAGVAARYLEDKLRNCSSYTYYGLFISTWWWRFRYWYWGWHWSRWLPAWARVGCWGV